MTDEKSNASSRWLEALEECGLELTPERIESLQADIDAVRRNVARIETLDLGSGEPAITLSVASSV